MSICTLSPIAINCNLIKNNKYTHISVPLEPRVKKSEKKRKFKVDKATPDGMKNYLKGMLTQLLYARGDA